MVTAIYAGTFDPFTNGHLDIVLRSQFICDELYISIGLNPNKKTLFSEEERIALIEEIPTIKYSNNWIKVSSFQGLLVDYAKKIKANMIIRGVRSVSDFEYESNLANINSSLASGIQTIFLPTKPELQIVSSSAVKELARFKAPISNMVSGSVEKAIYKKLGVDE